MTVIPSLSFTAVIAAFERAGWTVNRQKGSHIRLKKIFCWESAKTHGSSPSAHKTLDLS